MAELPEVPSTSSSSFPSTNLSFSCVSCGERAEELKCLPCLHSLALCEKVECQEKMLQQGVTCEICDEVFTIPPGGLPSHPFALRKAVRSKYQREGVVCQEDHEEKRAAVSYCTDCDFFICQECVDLHRSKKMFKRHQIQSINETLKCGSTKEDIFRCLEHNEKKKLYCHDCQQMICAICHSVGGHKTHSVSFINDKLGELNRSTLTQCVLSARGQTKALSNALQEVEASEATLQQQSADAVGEILAMKEQLIAMVTRRCDSLVGEVRKMEESGRKALAKERKVLQGKMKKWEEFLSISEDIFSNGRREEQLYLTKMLVKRVYELTGHSPQPSCYIHPSVQFISSKQSETEKTLSSFGGVCLSAHPPNCSIRGLEKNKDGAAFVHIQKKKEFSFKVTTRDERGNECRGGEKVSAVLCPVTAGVPLRGKVTDKRDGTYEVHFKSVPSLKCMLSVTIGGHHIVGSPVEVIGGHHAVGSPVEVIGGHHVVGSPVEAKIAKPLNIKKMKKIQKEIKFGGACFVVACGSDGMLYAGNYNTKEILVINRAGQIARRFTNYCGYVYGMTFSKSADGNIVISDYSNHVIKIYTPTGQLARQFGGRGSKQGQLSGPMGVAVNEEGHLFIAGHDNHRISVFTEDGQFLRWFGLYGIGAGCFANPCQLCISPDGLVYITDYSNHCIKVHDQEGRYIRQFGEGIVKHPTGIAVTSDGHIIVASSSANKISIFTPDGQCVRKVDNLGLDRPQSLSISDEGNLYIAGLWKQENCCTSTLTDITRYTLDMEIRKVIYYRYKDILWITAL